MKQIAMIRRKIGLSGWIILGSLLFSAPVFGQGVNVVSPFTTGTFRQQFHDGLITWSILKNLSGSLADPDEEYDFQSAFWPMELILYKTDSVRKRLDFAFSRVTDCGLDLQRGLVEVAYTNWPDTYHTEIKKLMQQTSDPKIFAMCAEYLWRGGKNPASQPLITTALLHKFPADSIVSNPILKMLDDRLHGRAHQEKRPPLPDLFSEQFAPGLTVLYSFQRADRDYPGRVIVRRPDGYFVRDTAGGVFSVPQLARAISNLPFYLTNGNTPQGIYRMSGFDVSRSRFIGPTQNIQLSMPFEIPVDSFIIPYPPGLDTTWTLDKYRSLLPSSWQSYSAFDHAYYAGEAGRTAIIAHGTTIDPEYYRTQVYYPQTPSQGCLCTHESWSPLTGLRLESDQQKLVDAVKEGGTAIGYVVVIETGDQKSPVRLDEILPFVVAAEKRL